MCLRVQRQDGDDPPVPGGAVRQIHVVGLDVGHVAVVVLEPPLHLVVHRGEPLAGLLQGLVMELRQV